MTKDFLTVGIGEVLWDLLPNGRQFGGSPVNVIYHCQAAGIPSTIVSAIGKDSDGEDILTELDNKNISKEYIQISEENPTGKVTVELNEGIPNFIIHPDVAWDKIRWNQQLEKLAKRADAVAFGSLPQRDFVSRNTMQTFIGKMKRKSLRVFDINLRQHFHSAATIKDSLSLCNILKINDEELPVLAMYLKMDGPAEVIIERIIHDYKLELLAYTKGANGSSIFTSDDRWDMKSPKVNIKDTVGAGDAFTGALIAGLLMQKEISEIHTEATKIAAWVCESNGAMPKY